MSAMPEGLSPRAEGFWRDWIAAADLEGPNDWLLLVEVVRTMTLLDDLRAQLDADGLMIDGSAGQRRLHPAVTELTKAQAQLDRLLARLVPREPVDWVASRRNQHAARVRWHGAASGGAA